MCVCILTPHSLTNGWVGIVKYAAYWLAFPISGLDTDPRNAQDGLSTAGKPRQKSQSGLARQLLQDMPVEDSSANKPHAIIHHFEQDILSFLANRDHVS